MAQQQSPTRTVARSTSALAEFHGLAGHAGPADGCQDCQAQLQRQRQAAGALRGHQRQTRQRGDAILANPYPHGIPAPQGACATCAYDPCTCATTDEATDLRLDDEAYGLLGDDEPEWGEG